MPDEHVPDDVPSPDRDVPSDSPHASDVHPRHAAEGGDEQASDDDVPGRGTPGRRHTFASLLRPRLNTSQLIVAVLCAALGFAFIVQVRQNQSDSLSSLRQSDLVRLLDDVTQRSQALEREYSSLRVTRDELQAGSGSQQAAIKLAKDRAATQGILSGRLPAQGPGVTLTIEEGTQTVGAATMFNVLEELRNAGAEAVQINGVRLVASSWFALAGNSLVVDDVPVTSPYTWVAIGDPDTLAPALGIPGGALAAVRSQGATAEVKSATKVEVTATREPEDPKYATPVPVSTAGTKR
ncbi:DUF881 domain-containing protein [Luteimicrobium subarcticum]|uniref:Uncharacterized protein YlxW (UPF0749 family) n=1 Tax=Luteimicrobium subarcticum TaxID=620910 RepID=A0A2M8W3S7_9MICO|nr:DUF881 domain-containing protein [Luteimicrobium subarcticum]PJI85583.1 uncharacterized protein YlxW (UPF0749 family) [Luteimicrobium subarcticum]